MKKDAPPFALPPITLVTNGYIPVPEDRLAYAEELIAELRAGTMTGFVMIAVGPETAGATCGFTGGRMDRITLLGNISMMRRSIEDIEKDETEAQS